MFGCEQPISLTSSPTLYISSHLGCDGRRRRILILVTSPIALKIFACRSTPTESSVTIKYQCFCILAFFDIAVKDKRDLIMSRTLLTFINLKRRLFWVFADVLPIFRTSSYTCRHPQFATFLLAQALLNLPPTLLQCHKMQ